MGNGCNHLHHQNMHSNHKPAFLPILCSRPSVKDASLPKWQHQSDPLSPKIGCMGQVKRSNRVVGCPIPHKFNIATKTNNGSNNGIKYFKLTKLFSGKNLTGTPATAAPTTSCRRKQSLANRTSRSKNGDEKDVSFEINIENMDPPLPVIKRAPKQGEKGDGDTLWERRSRGVALKSLQLQQIQLKRHQEPITV